MANKRSEIKRKQVEMIENNIKFIEILFYIFKGQVLDMDFKEFCLHYKICDTENKYKRVIKNLINLDILKIKKLVNTNNNVLVAKAPVYNFFNQKGKTTRYSVETIIRNSYINYIIINKLKLDFLNDTIETVEYLENNTTLLSKKRDVQSCYKMYDKYLTHVGQEAKKDALYKEEQRKRKLKNIHKLELEQIGIPYSETLQTLRERDIFVIKTEDRYKLYIIDNNSTYILSNLAAKIGVVIRVFTEQIQINMLQNLDIIVLVKNSSSKKRLEENFITKYKNSAKINLDKAINKAIKQSNYKINYKLIGKSRNGVYVLENTYNTILNKLRIQIYNTDIAKKHNTDYKTLALVQYKEKQKEQKQREKIIEELRREGYY